MTTLVGEAPAVPRLEHGGRVTQARVALSEWTKLRSLRSTRWSLLVAVVLTIGLPALFATVLSSHWGQIDPGERADHYRHRLDVALAGVNVSQLAIAVLGVLLITGEYSTGMIRASLTAVPRRLPVLWAKAMVFGAVVLGLMLPSVLIAFFASQAILRHHHILQLSFTHSGVPRAVVGSAVYLVLVGIFAMAIGAIVRSTAGGIATFAAIFFVIPPLMNVLPSSWNNAISPYLPDAAGRDMFSLNLPLPGEQQVVTHDLSPGWGFALFLGYCALALAIAAFLLRRRDA
ncbi:MAG: ABC transporter permease, partial [Candidatus Rokuibacteriota bacterium]